MKRFVEIINIIGESIIGFFINSVISSIFILPGFLLSYIFSEKILDVFIIFAFIIGLIGIATEGLINSYNQIFVKKMDYYKIYFFETLKEKVFQKYLFYVLTLTIAFYGLYSFYKLMLASYMVSILFYPLLFIWVNLIFFLLMQIVLREKIALIQLFRNAIILIFKYIFISIINFIIVLLYISFINKNLFTLTVYLNLFSISVVYVNSKMK